MDERTTDDTSRDADLLAGAWTGVSADVERERGLAGRLRRAPRWARLTLLVGGALAMPAGALAFMPRSDLAALVPAQTGLGATLVAALVAAGAALASRPLQARALPTGAVVALAAGAALVFGLSALLPPGLDPTPQPSGALLGGVLRCGSGVVAVAVAVFALARVVRRDAPGDVVGAAALAAASGVATLGLACPLDDLGHLALGHAAPAAVVVALGLWAYLRPGARASSTGAV